jgi:thymidylate synthase
MKTETKRVPVVDYIPYEKRPLNAEYNVALSRIMHEGKNREVEFHEGTMRKFLLNTMRFEMRNGFPLITEREITETFMRYAIAEIIGFIHGAVTVSELESFGLPKYWWMRWVNYDRVHNADGSPKFDLPDTEPGGHLGRFSYGGVWGMFPTQNDGVINQWENVIKQMIKSPTALTHRVTNWYPSGIIVPDGKRQVVVAPCHGDVQIDLNPKTRMLNLIHTQRAADVPTGVPYNMIHYAAIGMMLSCVLEYTFDEYMHVMNDSHVYLEKQEENVRVMLARSVRKLPTVTLDFVPTGNPVEDFFAIRPSNFHLSDYHPHPGMKIDTEL